MCGEEKVVEEGKENGFLSTCHLCANSICEDCRDELNFNISLNNKNIFSADRTLCKDCSKNKEMGELKKFILDFSEKKIGAENIEFSK